MCRCTPCNCCWCDICADCPGVSLLCACMGCWLCNPQSFPPQGRNCCFMCEQTGCGGGLFCIGGAICVPEWLIQWTKSRK